MDEILLKVQDKNNVNIRNFNDWFFSHPKSVSFLNPVNFLQLRTESELKIDFYLLDGMFMVSALHLISDKHFERLSFDYTSLADPFFRYCEAHQKKIYFVGAKQDELSRFINLLNENYPHLAIVGSYHGYVEEPLWPEIMLDIDQASPDVLIVGMGCPLQERFVSKARYHTRVNYFITCGGYIHQTQNKLRYYPKFIDRFHLRMPYRFIFEKHTRKRVFKYFSFLIVMLQQLLRK